MDKIGDAITQVAQLDEELERLQRRRDEAAEVLNQAISAYDKRQIKLNRPSVICCSAGYIEFSFVSGDSVHFKTQCSYCDTESHSMSYPTLIDFIHSLIIEAEELQKLVTVFT